MIYVRFSYHVKHASGCCIFTALNCTHSKQYRDKRLYSVAYGKDTRINLASATNILSKGKRFITFYDKVRAVKEFIDYGMNVVNISLNRMKGHT